MRRVAIVVALLFAATASPAAAASCQVRGSTTLAETAKVRAYAILVHGQMR